MKQRGGCESEREGPRPTPSGSGLGVEKLGKLCVERAQQSDKEVKQRGNATSQERRLDGRPCRLTHSIQGLLEGGA